MDNNFSKSLTQVNEVLKYTDVNLTNKIPDSFKKYITNNMATSYSYCISENDTADTIMNNLTNDAKAILGLIYRNFICSTDEKEYLLYLEKKYLHSIESHKSQQIVETDNIFQNDKSLSLENTYSNAPQTELNLIQVKNKWYIVLLEKLLKKLKG